MLFTIDEFEIIKEMLRFYRFNYSYNKEFEKKLDIVLCKLNLEEFYCENY